MRIDQFIIKTLVSLFLLSGFMTMKGQSLIKQEIDSRMNQRVPFEQFSPFSLTSVNDPEIEDAIQSPTFLKLDKAEINLLHSMAPENIQLTIPVKGANSITVSLYRNNSISEDLTVRYKSETGRTGKVDNGIHYWGVNQAAGNSLVAISIFEDDLKGLIADDSGNWNLGKLKNKEDVFIYYNDKNILNHTPNLSCVTSDEDFKIKIPEDNTGNKGNPKCVDIYVEVNYDIYLGTGANPTPLVNAIFNQSAILYANRGITIRLSDMFIWNGPSPYNGANSVQMLNQFQAQTNSWNGDIAHLLTYHAYGGVAAVINGLCHPNMNSRMCYSGIENNFVGNVPIYSWTVYVFSHENGHLLGSPHTHNCSWNGNNTAIDGCWSPEGNCFRPGYPSNGGTVMSYCHLVPSVGINFANGFHPQVGARMSNAINAAGCLALCNGPQCTVSVSPSSISVTPAGGNNAVQIIATSGQVWTASSNTSWITVTTNSGVGNGTLGFNVATNTGPARSGTISVSCATSSATVSVYQADGGCVANLTLNGSETGNKNYSASNTVTSTQILYGSSNIDYTGGNKVYLKPGFHAQPGADFHGYIAACFNGQATNGTSADRSVTEPSNNSYITQKGAVSVHSNSQRQSLELNLHTPSGFSFQVQDLEGKKVLSERHQLLETGVYKYDLEGLLAGIYIVTFEFEEEQKSIKLMVEE